MAEAHGAACGLTDNISLSQNSQPLVSVMRFLWQSVALSKKHAAADEFFARYNNNNFTDLLSPAIPASTSFLPDKEN